MSGRRGEQLDLFQAGVDEAAGAGPERGPSAPAPAPEPAESRAVVARGGGREVVSPARRRRGRRAKKPEPFRYSAEAGKFGWLCWPDGQKRLCETRLIETRRGQPQAVLIALDDGSTVLAPADGSLIWEPLSPEEACESVGIPPPPVERYEGFERRLDPHHVERHQSALWQLVVEHVTALPCGYGLSAATAGRTAPGGLGLTDEEPEVFACAVGEAIAGGAAPMAAIRSELAKQVGPDQEPAGVQAVLERTGWAAVLVKLERRIGELADEAERAPAEVSAAAVEPA